MMGRGNQDPSLAGAEIALLGQFVLEEHGVLISVSGVSLEDEAILRHSHCGEERRRVLRLAT
jgi:hypothetical protein